MAESFYILLKASSMLVLDFIERKVWKTSKTKPKVATKLLKNSKADR